MAWAVTCCFEAQHHAWVFEVYGPSLSDQYSVKKNQQKTKQKTPKFLETLAKYFAMVSVDPSKLSKTWTLLFYASTQINP